MLFLVLLDPGNLLIMLLTFARGKANPSHKETRWLPHQQPMHNVPLAGFPGCLSGLPRNRRQICCFHSKTQNFRDPASCMACVLFLFAHFTPIFSGELETQDPHLLAAPPPPHLRAASSDPPGTRKGRPARVRFPTRNLVTCFWYVNLSFIRTLLVRRTLIYLPYLVHNRSYD